MARDPEGPAAAQHAAPLVPALAVGRHAGSHPPRALREVPGSGRARGQPNGGDHRQPERQERRKRGARTDPHGFDAGKKIKGKKRHLLVDTLGLIMHAVVHSAGLQDRDGGVLVMTTLFGMYPFLRKLYADGGYQGPAFQAAVKQVLHKVDVEIVKRSDRAEGFTVLPKRWIVERSIAVDVYVDQPLPQAGQGLGEPQPDRGHLPAARLHPPHAAEAMQSKGLIWDGL